VVVVISKKLDLIQVEVFQAEMKQQKAMIIPEICTE
jgi:hypothetical protein